MELIRIDVISIYDGDTLTVSPIGVPKRFQEVLGTIKVRVSGINTPEKRGGTELEKQLDKLITQLFKDTIKNAKKVEIDLEGKLSFGRFHCDLYIDGVSWASILLDKKYAVEYDGSYSVKDFDWDKYIVNNNLILE